MRPAALPPGRLAPCHQGPLFFPPGDPHARASARPSRVPAHRLKRTLRPETCGLEIVGRAAILQNLY